MGTDSHVEGSMGQSRRLSCLVGRTLFLPRSRVGNHHRGSQMAYVVSILFKFPMGRRCAWLLVTGQKRVSTLPAPSWAWQRWLQQSQTLCRSGALDLGAQNGVSCSNQQTKTTYFLLCPSPVKYHCTDSKHLPDQSRGLCWWPSLLWLQCPQGDYRAPMFSPSVLPHVSMLSPGTFWSCQMDHPITLSFTLNVSRGFSGDLQCFFS